MRIELDLAADAAYVRLREVPYHHGVDLDPERRVDFGADNQPIGIELLNVSEGVDVRGLPDGQALTHALQAEGLRVLSRSR
jgi:uncharacterized protein YuzE